MAFRESVLSMKEIFTIGYGGRKTHEFVALLREYDIDVLVDVRSQPYSRYSDDFSKGNLSRILKRHDIEYEFMGDSLGGKPSDRDCYSFSPRRKKHVLDPNKCERKDFYRNGISNLKRALSQGNRIVIMCSELEPHDCHRGYVIGKTLDRDEIAVVHIGRHGERMSQNQIPQMNYQKALL